MGCAIDTGRWWGDRRSRKHATDSLLIYSSMTLWSVRSSVVWTSMIVRSSVVVSSKKLRSSVTVAILLFFGFGRLSSFARGQIHWGRHPTETGSRCDSQAAAGFSRVQIISRRKRKSRECEKGASTNVVDWCIPQAVALARSEQVRNLVVVAEDGHPDCGHSCPGGKQLTPGTSCGSDKAYSRNFLIVPVSGGGVILVLLCKTSMRTESGSTPRI